MTDLSIVKSTKKSTKKTAKKTTPEVKAPVAPTTFEYENTTKYNKFTTAGRVHPGCTIMLAEDEAALHEGLNRV